MFGHDHTAPTISANECKTTMRDWTYKALICQTHFSENTMRGELNEIEDRREAMVYIHFRGELKNNQNWKQKEHSAQGGLAG